MKRTQPLYDRVVAQISDLRSLGYSDFPDIASPGRTIAIRVRSVERIYHSSMSSVAIRDFPDNGVTTVHGIGCVWLLACHSVQQELDSKLLDEYEEARKG